jgi:peptidoglycan/LPS O-acetylase OafA/YrhL
MINSSKQNAHYPGLDTLRALAILMVIPFHLWQALKGEFVGDVVKTVVKHGWAGVDLFFVLSGFLIASQLFQSLQRDGRVNFRRFYFKRTLRILPSYYFVILLYYLWPAFREKPDLGPSGSFVFFWMNYRDKAAGFSHAWSLCVEEHFYLLFPACVALWAVRPRLFRPAFLLPLALLSEPLLRLYLWTIDIPFFPFVYRQSHTHFDGLLVGISLALIRHARPHWWRSLTSKPWLTLGCGLILVGLGMGLYTNLDLAVSYALSLSLVGFGFGFLLLAAMSPEFWLAEWKVPGAATVAALAFTLYLTHKQMIHLAAGIVGTYMDQKVATVVLATILSAVAATAIHYLIEKPFLTLRDRALRKPVNKL